MDITKHSRIVNMIFLKMSIWKSTSLCQNSVNSRAHKSESKDECEYGHIFEPGAFLIIFHNVTLFGIDNPNKCHIMQICQKSLRFGDMTILTPIFRHTFLSSGLTVHLLGMFRPGTCSFLVNVHYSALVHVQSLEMFGLEPCLAMK